MTTFDIRKNIENLIDESRHDSLKNLNAIKHIGIDSEKDLVILIIEIGRIGTEAESHLKRQLAKVVKLDLGFKGIKISFQEVRNFQNSFNQNTKFIIVSSGKGGVGKSFVSTNLAYALKRLGKNVGLIDADIYGACVPKYLETPYANIQVNHKNKIIPFRSFGIEFISMEFFADEGQPIVWRGSVLQNMINNFFYQVEWSKDLDYVIIDAPTGTMDVILDLSKIVPNAECLIVTTPDKTSSYIATKAANALKDMHHNIIGVVENLCNEEIYGKGGAEVVAEKIGTEVLVQIPIKKPTYHDYLYEDSEENGKIFDDLANIITIRD